MSCHGCATKFGLLTKEIGCSVCGYSFCSKCSKHKIKLPGQGSDRKRVCNSCFKKLVEGSTADEAVEPPDILIKRLETLENPSKPPIIMIQPDNRLSRLKKGLSVEDQEIVDRLEKLKEDRRSVPVINEDEIRKRLAVLKGEDPEKCNKPVQLQPDTRTDIEKSNDLIEQYKGEVKLSGMADADIQQLEARLHKLRGVDSAKKADENPVNVQEEEEDDETATAKIISKAIEEAELEKKLGISFDNDELLESSDHDTDKDELPWCVICNENAVIRCYGCDGDLYCAFCFKEGHDSFEMKEHNTVPFKPKPKAQKSTP